jgi:hypothetical protein
MSRIRYNTSSVYSVTPVRNEYLDLYVSPIEPDFTQAQPYVITQKYDRRPDLLAYDLYNDSKYWWIFSLYNRNKIKDPLFDFKTGLEILIPNDLTSIGR